MIVCRHCGVSNPPSGNFCSQCGFALAQGDIDAALAANASAVAEGQRLFGEGRVQEAQAVAEHVLTADPDNIAALALKGDCLERTGDLVGALESYEQVVTLKPDSPLDRIRVAQLRRMASVQPLVDVGRQDRRSSIFASVAACVLLAAVGSTIVLASRRDQPVGNQVPSPQKTEVRPFLAPAPVPTQEAKSEASSPRKGDGTQDMTAPSDADAEPQEPVRPNRTAPASGRRPNGSGVGLGGSGLPPIDPNSGFVPIAPDVNLTPTNPSPKGPTTSDDPPPAPLKSDADRPKTDRTGRQPIVDIHPSPGQNNDSVGGSQPRNTDVNEGKSLIQVARQHFLAGEYEKAAKAYERAIKLGASPASANHRLAQCYVNLNRRGEALSAYQKALSAYQSMLDQGIGDRRLIERYMDECRQSIKLLQ